MLKWSGIYYKITMAQKNPLFRFLSFLFTITIGLVYGLLFARKSGKDFRRDLKNSTNKPVTFLKELFEVDIQAMKEAAKWADKSESLQGVIGEGKDQFKALVKQAQTLGTEASQKAQTELEGLVKNAQDAVSDLKKEAKKTVKTVKKTATKKVKTVKKDATKKVAAVKKTATKKVATAKKAATKKVDAVKKTLPKK